MTISTGPPAPVLHDNVHPDHGKEKGRDDGEVGLVVNILAHISSIRETRPVPAASWPVYGTHSLMPHVPSRIP